MALLHKGWIAGFFDGEGSCFVTIRKGNRGQEAYIWRIQPVVTIRQSNRLILEQIKEELGITGCIGEGISGLSGKKTWSLAISSRRDILTFIEAIEEFVVLRKHQLELMKELINIKVGRRPWTGKQLLYATRISKEVVSMNPKVKSKTLDKIEEAIQKAEEFSKEG